MRTTDCTRMTMPSPTWTWDPIESRKDSFSKLECMRLSDLHLFAQNDFIVLKYFKLCFVSFSFQKIQVVIFRNKLLLFLFEKKKKKKTKQTKKQQQNESLSNRTAVWKKNHKNYSWYLVSGHFSWLWSAGFRLFFVRISTKVFSIVYKFNCVPTRVVKRSICAWLPFSPIMTPLHTSVKTMRECCPLAFVCLWKA